jgi:geranylgeranyl reductase family protein
MKPAFDVAVVGGGPAGAICAAFCAQAGLKTVVIERARFPRDKVCGDCLNPMALPVIDALALRERVFQLAHARLLQVEFRGCDDECVQIPLPPTTAPEIGIRRSLFDALLLERAAECGAEVLQETTVVGLSRTDDEWRLATTGHQISSKWLVAADGRNSSVARLLGVAPAVKKDRVAIQTHLPLPPNMSARVRMQFVPEGYAGIADIGASEANLCLVSRPPQLDALRQWATRRYGLAQNQTWRTITPLSRASIPPTQDRLLLIGDVARVVEPFTGEGIAYAMLTGQAAARSLAGGDAASYTRAHARLYSGRLWVNHLARFACLHPHFATILIRLGQRTPKVLSALTCKVTGARQ